jgi:superfamily I DNA/RNA helicase
MLRLLLPALSLFMAVSQSSTYASSQQSDIHRLDPLLQSVEVSLEAHQALVEQLHVDQETLLALGRAAGDDLQPIFVAEFKDYRDSVEVAVSVSSAIAGVNQTAITLFEEWRDEIGYLTDTRLKADNEAQFAASWQRYEDLTQSLQQSEAMIDPVLAELRKFLIYFKYALDEPSIASQKTELSDTDNNIEALIKALTASAIKSKAFLAQTQ